MKTILFIDRRPHVCRNVVNLLSGQLELFGVLTAPGLTEAADILKTVAIELIIAGRQLGIKETEALKRYVYQREGMKLILLSESKSALGNVIKAFEYNIQLETPVDVNVLLDTLLTELDVGYGGQLKGVSLSSFIQMIELEGLTCSVKVISEQQTGCLYFQSGNLIDAALGNLSGKEAALRVLNMKNPLISINYSNFKKERAIYDPLMSLLLESGRLNDEFTVQKNSDRRRHERFACQLPIAFDCGAWTYKGIIRNISMGGLYIETSDPFSRGQQIQLALGSLSLQRTCNVTCRIMRRDPAGIGVAFMAVSMVQKRIIATIIEEIKTPSTNQEPSIGTANP